jgi:hypothetical protein
MRRKLAGLIASPVFVWIAGPLPDEPCRHVFIHECRENGQRLTYWAMLFGGGSSPETVSWSECREWLLFRYRSRPGAENVTEIAGRFAVDTGWAQK